MPASSPLAGTTAATATATIASIGRDARIGSVISGLSNLATRDATDGSLESQSRKRRAALPSLLFASGRATPFVALG